MKNLINVFISLAFACSANQILAQDPESQETATDTSSAVQNTQVEYAAPNETINNVTSGCWSDYLRHFYKQESIVYSADLFATRDDEK
ncbi:MAG: hypothetical protein ACFHHU_08155 [Porticoccaceae bacterium]